MKLPRVLRALVPAGRRLIRPAPAGRYDLDAYGLPREHAAPVPRQEGAPPTPGTPAPPLPLPEFTAPSVQGEPPPEAPGATPAENEHSPIEHRRASSALTARPVYTGFMLTVGVGLALLIFSIAQANTQLLAWIGAALFIALGLDPIVRLLERIRCPRPLGVVVTVGSFLAVVGTVIAMLSPLVTEQTSVFIRSLPQLVGDISRSDWFRSIDEDFQIQEIIDNEVNRYIADPSNITNALGGLFGVGTAILTTSFGLLVVTVLALYFLASLPSMKAWGYRLAPRSSRPRIQYLGDLILSGVGYYVIGQACVAVLNGIVAYIAIRIADVPFGALFAVIAGVLAFIPLVGPVTGGALVSVVGLTVDWQTAATFAIIYFIYLQIEAYIVSPRIMSRAVKIPAAVVVISVIAGGSILGVLGALMAIPTAAAVMLLTREVLIKRQDTR